MKRIKTYKSPRIGQPVSLSDASWPWGPRGSSPSAPRSVQERVGEKGQTSNPGFSINAVPQPVAVKDWGLPIDGGSPSPSPPGTGG
jgi:hypothetical protein